MRDVLECVLEDLESAHHGAFAAQASKRHLARAWSSLCSLTWRRRRVLAAGTAAEEALVRVVCYGRDLSRLAQRRALPDAGQALGVLSALAGEERILRDLKEAAAGFLAVLEEAKEEVHNLERYGPAIQGNPVSGIPAVLENDKAAETFAVACAKRRGLRGKSEEIRALFRDENSGVLAFLDWARDEANPAIGAPAVAKALPKIRGRLAREGAWIQTFTTQPVDPAGGVDPLLL